MIATETPTKTLTPSASPGASSALSDRRAAAISSRTAVALLTVAALGIRLVIVRGFWLDEATSGYDARLSYAAMLRQLLHDNHPPLDYTILWAVAHFVGSSQLDLRLPSILFGTLMIPMLYLAGRALYHERVGVLAAALGTVAPLVVWYSQEARMYALFMLLATVSIWAQSRALGSDRRRYWLAWGVAAAAMIWNQWFASLAVGAEILVFAGALLGRHRSRRPLLHLGVSVTGVALACAPGVPLLLTQFHNNQANGLGFGSHTTAPKTGGISPYGIFDNLVWALWGYHSNGIIDGVVAVWPLGILLVLLLLGRGRHPSNRILLTVIAVPMTLVFVASAKTAPSRSLFEIRYFIEAVPALLLLLSGMVWTMAPSPRLRRGAVGILLATFTLGLVLQQSDGDNPRMYGYDAAFHQIASVARPGDELLYAPTFLNVDVAYFAPSMAAAPVTEATPRLPSSARIFVLGSFGFSGEGGASTNEARLVSRLEHTRHLVRTFRAPDVFVWEFS